MNFISMESPKNQVELKYCERCGGLFLRARTSDVVFCAECALRLAELPEPTLLMPKKAGRKSRKPRLVQGPKSQEEFADEFLEEGDAGGPVRIGSLQGVAMEVGSC